jgi:hypothetical protein
LDVTIIIYRDATSPSMLHRNAYPGDSISIHAR